MSERVKQMTGFVSLGGILPLQTDTKILKTPLTVGENPLKNRLAIQPMEGCDGTTDGAPGEFTVRRYNRLAESGAGLLWFEATAVVHEGRANPRQLFLQPGNQDAFARLLDEVRERAQSLTGTVPIIIMQATHSGRYSKPDGRPAPLIAYNNPLFEGENTLPPDRIITDDELKLLEEKFAETAKLAVQAGFDGIDVKACHGYLNSELLNAHTRTGEYGGSFENRTRFFRNAVDAVRAVVPKDFIVTSRMNIYDGYPYPYGYGVAGDGGIKPDLSEPIELLQRLKFDIVDITMGNPYQNPHVNRPTELEAVKRMLSLTSQIQKALPQTAVVGSGFTYLKENSGKAAAGAIEQGVCALAGFGRMAFAYPAFARDILSGSFDKKQSCITCGKCTELMRAGQITGCVIRDDIYTRLYKEVFAK